jgi:hypothetical protein
VRIDTCRDRCAEVDVVRTVQRENRIGVDIHKAIRTLPCSIRRVVNDYYARIGVKPEDGVGSNWSPPRNTNRARSGGKIAAIIIAVTVLSECYLGINWGDYASHPELVYAFVRCHGDAAGREERARPI